MLFYRKPAITVYPSKNFMLAGAVLLALFVRAQEPLMKDTSRMGIAPSATEPVSSYLNNIQMTALYKEANHFSTLAPLGEIFSGKKYVFTADINPLYIFSNSIRSRWNFGVGARVLARMFQDSSYPVRTPSFMPTVKLFYSISNIPSRYRFIKASFTHHSNGQDGPSKINGEWNDRNGNFSTNWVALNYSWGDNEGSIRNHFSVYGIEHTNIGQALSQDDSLDGYYGKTRVGFDFQRRFIQQVSIVNKQSGEKYFGYGKERFRIHGYVNIILAGLDKYPDAAWKRRINSELNVHYFLKSLREGGFFAGVGYYGEDPYNIYFHNHYFFVRFGISAGTAFFKPDE